MPDFLSDVHSASDGRFDFERADWLGGVGGRSEQVPVRLFGYVGFNLTNAARPLAQSRVVILLAVNV